MNPLDIASGVDLPPDVRDQVRVLLSWMSWLAWGACVMGIVLTAGGMAISWYQGNQANIVKLAWVLVACVLLGSTAAIVTEVWGTGGLWSI